MDNMIKKEFDQISIPKLVIKLGIPSMLAQFINVLYSVIDRIFVGHIPQVGSLAIAGIGVSAPILTSITAFASLIGIGGASVMSFSMGSKKDKEAEAAIGNSLILLIILSVILTLLLTIFQKTLLYFLGCSDTLYPYAGFYFKIYLLGTPAVLLGLGMNQFVIAQGHSKAGMIAIVFGAVTNTILDPVFIFLFHFGICGAAIATVTAQWITAIFVFSILLQRKIEIPLKFVPLQKEIIRRLLYIGSLPFMVTLLENMFLMILNMVLRKYGGDHGDEYIACSTVVQSFIVFAFNPGYGLSQGCGTLYAYHYGAGNYKKIMQVFQWVLIVCGIYMTILCILSQEIPEFFAGLFLQDPSLIPEAAQCIRKYSAGLFILAVQYSFVDGLTSMGLIKYAMPIFAFRRIIYAFSILILPIILPLNQVFWSETIGDVIGSLVSIFAFCFFIRPKIKQQML